MLNIYTKVKIFWTLSCAYLYLWKLLKIWNSCKTEYKKSFFSLKLIVHEKTIKINNCAKLNTTGKKIESNFGHLKRLFYFQYQQSQQERIVKVLNFIETVFINNDLYTATTLVISGTHSRLEITQYTQDIVLYNQ